MLRTLLGASSLLAIASCTTLAPETDTQPKETQDTMAAKPAKLTPPVAQRIDKVTEQAGRTRTDPYAWLRDDNWQDVMQDPNVLNANIREYLEAENAFTKAKFEAPTEALREELFEEMKGRIKEDDASVPMVDGDYAYYRRFRQGGEYPIYARKSATDAHNADAEETVLLDGDVMGEGLEYFDFGAVAHSPDHSMMAYTVDDKGSEFYTLRIKNAETGEDLGIEIENTYGVFDWSADSKAIYWILRNENNRPEKIFRRVIGSGVDELVYQEKDPGYFLSVGRSQSGKFMFIRSGDHTTSEYYVIPSDAEDQVTPQLIAEREQGVEYELSDWNGKFYIKTNADGAVDFKIMSAEYEKPGRENWIDVVTPDAGVLLLSVQATKNHLVRTERENGLPRIVITSLSEEGALSDHEIAFPEAAYDIDAISGYAFDTDNLRMIYASPSTPDQTFDYNMATRERVLRKTREVPSGHTAEDYVVERIMAPAHDGETIPVTILRHKDTPVDGSAPLLLYGYGSYGHTISADFRTSRLSLVDRGFIYAIAHIRGSMAKGYQWYLDGKLEKKTNTFKDYVSAGRHLTANGYGAPGNVVGMGGSAGGLLMGAAANMDPELFAGIVAAVPFVDVLNTMSDTELPLTPPEWPEWGNPIESGEDYDTILAYSPYDNVVDKPYPAMLITGGLTDPRVTYWEPAKWAAKLRHEAPEAGPYYLRINMGAGHGGASGRFEGLKETAINYAFALAAVGKTDTVNLKADD